MRETSGQYGKDAFLIKVLEKLDPCRNIKTTLYIVPHIKTVSRWTIYLNMKGKTIKLLKNNFYNH